MLQHFYIRYSFIDISMRDSTTEITKKGMKMKRFILWAIIFFLAVLPFVTRYIYHFRSQDRFEIEQIASQEKEVLRDMRLDHIPLRYVSSSLKIMPHLPDDLIYYSNIAFSLDGKNVAIIGGPLQGQKVYVAPFPPQKKEDYVLVADLPKSYDVTMIRWSPFEKDHIGFYSIEQSDNPPSDEEAPLEIIDYEYKTVEIGPDGKLEEVLKKIHKTKPNTRKKLDVVFYTVDVPQRKLEKCFTEKERQSLSFLQEGGEKIIRSFEWLTPDSILKYNGTNLTALSLRGETLNNTETGYLGPNILLDVNNDNATFFLFGHRINKENSVAEGEPLLIDIDWKTGKTTKEIKFSEKYPAGTIGQCNGKRLLDLWSSNGNFIRILVIDRDELERRIIYCKKCDPEDIVYIRAITPDGKSAICHMVKDGCLFKIGTPTHPDRRMFELAVIPLD